jgi:prepilin-type N-terminal cleavage/methylation domain-containing protein
MALPTRERVNPAPVYTKLEGAFTLIEVMVATMLVAIFFASIFELNALCLRYMDSSKESLAALQSVQDRAEVLRNLAFSDLTTTSFVRDNVMPANYTPDQTPTLFSKKATEVVKIKQYPTANGVTQFTRLPNGTVTTDSVATNLGLAQLVKVDVSVSWTMTLGGRARTEQTSSIVSNGTKK